MKKIEAIIRHFKLDDIKTALTELEALQKPENKEFWAFKNYIKKQLDLAAN